MTLPVSVIQNNNITVGCRIISLEGSQAGLTPWYPYLPPATTITDIIPYTADRSHVFLSNVFDMAPTGFPPNQDTIDIEFECGCDDWDLTVMDLDDDDDGNASIDNPYSVTQHFLGSFNAGTTIPNVAYLQITPDQGNIIRASDFSINNAPPSGNTGGVPVFAGTYLPFQVAYVKFEDSDNQIYTNYTDPNGTDPNPNYDPNWVPTTSNYVAVIVALNPVPMPNHDLDIKIDIDQVNFQSTTPIITNVTLT